MRILPTPAKRFSSRLLTRSATAAAIIWMASGSSHALGLIQAYQDALHNDPTYVSAKFENEADKQSKAIGRAGLLPNVTASYSNSNNRADITTKGLASGPQVTQPEYKSVVQNVSLRQPIINLDALARYHQGVAQVQASDAILITRGQELMVRLANAYVDALFADEQLTLAIAQRDTLVEQKKVNDRLLQKGEGTKTDVLETQARLDLAEAQVFESRDAQDVARSALAAIVGHDVGKLDQLRSGFHVMPLQPSGFEAWKTLALANNTELVAQTYTIESARQEISRTRAGHAPRLDFVASYSKNESETLNTLNQDSVIRSIGIQLNIPLYSGGYVNATSKQAVSNYERAKADYSVRTDRILNDLQRQHSLVVTSVARIDALDKAVESARLLILATEQSIKGGVRINLDLLNARQQFYLAQRDLAQARYNYLQATLRLRAAAGTLVADDLDRVAAYFGPTS